MARTCQIVRATREAIARAHESIEWSRQRLAMNPQLWRPQDLTLDQLADMVADRRARWEQCEIERQARDSQALGR